MLKLTTDIMPFFRRSLDLNHATAHAADPADITAVSRLLRDSLHRFLGTPSGDLPALLATAPAAVLTSSRDIWGAAVAHWPTEDTSWLRALVLADGIPIERGLDLLLPTLFGQARTAGVRRLFYAGDTAADHWIQPALLVRGWVRQTDVIVYEKSNLTIPDSGDQTVRIRRAQPVDLPVVLALDHASFDAQWMKDESVLAFSLAEQAFFVLAERDGQAIGYAFATNHFNGKLMHLVRIAVAPAARGGGVGVRLMAELIQYAQRSGAESLTLNTQQENRTAQRLYEWFGFYRTGERQTVLRRDL